VNSTYCLVVPAREAAALPWAFCLPARFAVPEPRKSPRRRLPPWDAAYIKDRHYKHCGIRLAPSAHVENLIVKVDAAIALNVRSDAQQPGS
jgi:hypothetical protein